MQPVSPLPSFKALVTVAGGLVAVALFSAVLFWWRGAREPASAEIDFDAVTIEVAGIRDNVRVLHAHGKGEFSAGNITVFETRAGLVLVDTQYDQIGAKNLAAIRSFTAKPILHVVDTHFHVDHTSGNEFFRVRANVAEGATSTPVAVQVLAHEKVLKRLQRPPEAGGRRAAVWPTDTYDAPELTFSVDGELIRVVHQPDAHTDGDSFVVLAGADVISAGDIFHSERYPFIDRGNGGSFAGVVAALDRLVDLAARTGSVPEATVIVPGHGRVASESEVAEYRDMMEQIGARIRAMVDMGMSVSQIVAAAPTMEFDARLGATTGFWRTGDFVAAIASEMRAESGR